MPLRGGDTFVFRFGQSISGAIDRITDFTIGEDKIDLLTAGGLAAAAPVAFSLSANNNTAGTIGNLVANVFTDADGARFSNQPLGLNSAALVVATNSAIAGTYLIVNDGQSGYQAATDLIVDITGYSPNLPGLGSISPSAWFV